MNLNQVPSQVIYTSSFLLSACWLPSLNAFALGNADGDISLYRISYSQPSALYHNGSIQSYYDSNEYTCNGLFDSVMKEPFIFFFLLLFLVLLYSVIIQMLFGVFLIMQKLHIINNIYYSLQVLQVLYFVMILRKVLINLLSL